MDEDWDNLLILDACRYDQFTRLNTICGNLEARTSLGSATPEFLEKNFHDSIHHDTVYVTANPMYRTLNLGDVFHSVVDVWNTGWDEQQKTVPPEEVTEAALSAHEKYPNKRLIVHFMQPHYPFIGNSSESLGDHAGFEHTYRAVTDGEASRDNPTVWELIESGAIDERSALDAYDENLTVVLPHVERLVNEFPEKTVVTSDHGNLVGERILPFGSARYGHPRGTYTEGLRKVPWLIIDGKTRKEVNAETPRRVRNEDTDVVSERLANLGYTET
ncbi:LTA synthase family protein [Haloplanus halophilus]|uniref:LTA synthase family protein n=1 Tax=Haloplanus halophilus TaxID=2949993 RepID=UPI00203DA5D1|nr:LTA synthase family protein [Haloplanus sp. GDY1]